MTAGTGVQHSEFNPSPTQPVHFFQVWIIPEKNGLKPGYEQKKFNDKDKQNKWCLIASHDGAEGSVKVHQNIKLFISSVQKEKPLSYKFQSGRYGWLQLIKGNLEVNGQPLSTGDGAAIINEGSIEVVARNDSEFFLFDLL